MIEPENAKLIVLAILREHRMQYADVLAAYARRTGVGNDQATDEFVKI